MHYAYACTKIDKREATKKCYKVSCRNILGPSNTFTCSKCSHRVCLSHRMPEDHDCSNAIKERGSNKLSSNNSLSIKAKVVANTMQSSSAHSVPKSIQNTRTTKSTRSKPIN